MKGLESGLPLTLVLHAVLKESLSQVLQDPGQLLSVTQMFNHMPDVMLNEAHPFDHTQLALAMTKRGQQERHEDHPD